MWLIVFPNPIFTISIQELNFMIAFVRTQVQTRFKINRQNMLQEQLIGNFRLSKILYQNRYII